MNRYKIADLVINMEPKSNPLLAQSRAYLYDGDEKAIINLEVTEELFRINREKMPFMDDNLIEYIVSGNLFYMVLLAFHGMLLHSSAVEMDGRAYLFSAPSGTGKSTHTALWLKTFGDRAKILNDDKPAIRVFENGVFVFGTPWSGKSNLNLNRKVKLGGICFLERGKENQIWQLSQKEAIPNLLDQTIRPSGVEPLDALLNQISAVVSNVPIYKMKCNMNPDAAEISYGAMSKGSIL